MGDEAIGHTVVICSENHRELLEPQRDFIEFILDFSLLIHDSLNSLGYASSAYFLNGLDAAEKHALDCGHGNAGLVKQEILTMSQGI